jgi:hypothetical protein
MSQSWEDVKTQNQQKNNKMSYKCFTALSQKFLCVYTVICIVLYENNYCYSKVTENGMKKVNFPTF